MINILNKNKIYKSSSAFTLAELLITIGVLGVVAAITLPAVINNIQDKQFHAKWKKTYATIANAYNLTYQDNPIHFEKIYGDEKKIAAKELYYNIFSKLNTLDYCVLQGLQGKICQVNQGLIKGKSHPKCHSLDSSVEKSCAYNGEGGIAYLVDGTVIYAQAYIWQYPQFLIDVNGTKGPNVIGRDMYIILFRENRVIPGGAEKYELYGCNKKTPSRDENTYTGADTMSGSGCGAKYLLE